MKKTLFALVFLIHCCRISAQITTNNSCNKKFYKSYEDYKSGVAVEGVNVVRQEYTVIYYTQNGTEERVGPNKLPYYWFCNQEGTLMRVVGNKLYYVLVDGAVCFYIPADETNVSKRSNKGDYSINSAFVATYPAEFYSLTPNGEIERLRGKTVNQLLEKYGLTAQYEADEEYKKEWGKDSQLDILNKRSNKIIKYMRIMNTK